MESPLIYLVYFLLGLSVLYFLAFILASWLSHRLSESRFVPFLDRLSPSAQAGVGVFTGLLTPFCSCSTIPIFLGLLESPLPRRTAMCFLIASPLVSPPAFLLSVVLLGWSLTGLYILAAIVISLVGGFVLAQDMFRNEIRDFLFVQDDAGEEFQWRIASQGALQFIGTLVPALIIAGLIATSLRYWGIPNFLQDISQNYPAWAVPLASLLGGVLYADLIMIIPIANEALLQSLPLNIVLPFLMAASGVGIPSLILLSRIFSRRLMVVYMVSIFSLISLVGYASPWWIS